MQRHAISVLAATMAASTLLSAQVTVTATAAVNSQYQARGLTTTNRPVIQSELAVSAPFKRATVSGGLWSSAEAGRYNSPEHDISENAGARAGIAEWNYWIESTIPVLGPLSVTPGALGYIFPNRTGTTPESNTVELYVALSLDVPLSPSVTAWHDIHAVDGVYTELSLAHSVRSVDLGATMGWNATQSMGDGGPLGYYARRGITHVELSAARTLTLGALSLTPSAHVVWGSDPMTYAVSPQRAAGAKLWFGTALGFTR